ncbi:protein phosphatase, partial [Micromonospora azadirachtae]
MVDGAEPVSRTLRAAPPDQLVEAADQAIRSVLGATRTEVFIADYRIDGLWPMLDAELSPAGLRAQEAAARRCFSSQRPVQAADDEGRCRMFLPLSVWGERLGVLMIELPGAPGPRVEER